jgi:hypothetical protein
MSKSGGGDEILMQSCRFGPDDGGREDMVASQVGPENTVTP